MNKNNQETLAFLDELRKIQKDVKSEFGIASSFTSLHTLKENKTIDMLVFAQDISEHESGAYTGQVSPSMLKELEIDGVIIGHSERRQYNSESDQVVNAKALNAINNDLIPVICVGESLDDKQRDLTESVIEKQVKRATKGITNWSNVIIAYEPLWAIGTGEVASPKDAEQVCEFIREITHKDVRILYGGSVTPENIQELLEQPNINGALVGGASLEPKSFLSLIK